MSDTDEPDPPEQVPAALERWGDRNAPAIPLSTGKALTDTLLSGRARLHQEIMSHPTSKETLEFLRARRESWKTGPTK